MPDDDYVYTSNPNPPAGSDEAAQPAQPAGPDLSKIEQRLDGVTKALRGMESEQKTREQKSRLATQEAHLASQVHQTKRAVDAAERDLSAAFDTGDGAAIAKAQRALTERVAERERASNAQQYFKSQIKETESRSGGSSGNPGDARPQETELDTTNLNNWKKKHGSWYGVDTEMTKAAHEVSDRIVKNGVITVGSPEYFEAIDRQMSQRFPSKFGSAPETAGGGGSEDGRRERGSSTGRIPREVIDGWARMGINVDDDKTLQRMVKNRQSLADKGILPGEPAYGRVVSR